MRKVIIHTKGIQRSLEYYYSGKCGTRMLFGVIELQQFYKAMLFNVNTLWKTTRSILTNKCDVIYILDFLPKLYLPFPILKLLTFRKRKFLVLMHSHPYGKGKEIINVAWYKRYLLNYWCKGIDKALFFDPLSMRETINCGALSPAKCQMIHWGEDLDFEEIKSLPAPSACLNSYWIATGKERRDMESIKKLTDYFSKDKFLYVSPQYSYFEALQLTKRAKGVVVTPNKEGLTYCCGITNIIEAFALGKPIIAVKNNHYPFDIEKEGCGYYVDCYDYSRIIEIMNMIDRDENLYYSLCINSKRMSEYYNMSIFRNELRNIIEAL